jgi:hypothetical protein
VAEGPLAHGSAVFVDDPHTEEQEPLVRPGAVDRVQHRGARVRQQIVVVVQLLDPLAGCELDGTVQVLDQGQTGAVPDVPVSAGPCCQEPLGDLPGGVVVRSVRHGDLDVLGHGGGGLDDRPEGALEEGGPVTRRHCDRQHGRRAAGRPPVRRPARMGVRTG